LPRLIELAWQVYPSASRFDIFTKDDPEIANDRNIIFELDVPLDLEQILEADRHWRDGLFPHRSSPASVCLPQKR
jgi:hypothetical protein